MLLRRFDPNPAISPGLRRGLAARLVRRPGRPWSSTFKSVARTGLVLLGISTVRIDSDNNGAQQREAFFPTLLAKRPDVQLDKLENDSPDEQVAPILAQAHVYQIGARAVGVAISKREIQRLLTERQDDFLAENRDVLRAGLQTSPWISVDDTGARHQAANGYCTQIGNDHFTWFGTRATRAG